MILKRDPFDRIAKKTKRFEYRDYTPYWRRRIENREYNFIHFRNPDRSGLRRLSGNSQTRDHSNRRGLADTRSLPSASVAS